jgi:predicted  nucleic acid-binding Zn-ribbon protein
MADAATNALSPPPKGADLTALRAELGDVQTQLSDAREQVVKLEAEKTITQVMNEQATSAAEAVEKKLKGDLVDSKEEVARLREMLAADQGGLVAQLDAIHQEKIKLGEMLKDREQPSTLRVR